MSRKPAVVTVATRAVRRSMRALVANVVPWMKPAISVVRACAWSSTRRKPRSAPSVGSDGVVGVLAVASTWLSPSTRTVSVNVPPMSTAIRRSRFEVMIVQVKDEWDRTRSVR